MKEKLGLLHLYHGDGKGKTTAAIGLALRALGCGYRVLIVQFLKDGDSGELAALKTFPNAELWSGKSVKGFTFTMTKEEKSSLAEEMTQRFRAVITSCDKGDCEVVVLDEILDAVNADLLPWEEVYAFFSRRPEHIEFVLTGRNPKPELLELADYITEMKKIKHPYDQGIPARKGVEF